MSSLTRQQLEAWIRTLKVSGRVLDAGGSQKLAKGRIGAEEGTEFVTLDLEEPHENSQKPTIICDLNEIYTIVSVFDYALCFEVAEYWWNPYQALKNLNGFLKEGGILYMSVPFIYPVHNPKHNDYLRYTDMGIIKLLENAGFKDIKLIPRKANNHEILRSFFSGEGMKPSREYGSHDSMGWLIEATKI